MVNFSFEDENLSELKNLYNKFEQNNEEDETSKNIFLARSLYSITGDKKYFQDVVRNSVIGKELIQVAKNHSNMKLVMFGTGIWGKTILKYFPEIKWSYLVDNKHAGEELSGYKIVSLDSIINDNNIFIVIAIKFIFKEVEQQLINAGFNRNNYFIPGRFVEQTQYLDLKELNFNDNESFVDVDAYDGSSTIEFINKNNGKYKNIYMFEPSDDMYAFCCGIAKKYNNINVYKNVAWSEKTFISFSDDSTPESCITTGCNKRIEAIRLDDCLKDKEISYIKMDIEGAEMQALEGVRTIISEQKPKLAISVYHKPIDIWEIPIFILSLNPDYKLYLRIYSYTGTETVLYAI